MNASSVEQKPLVSIIIAVYNGEKYLSDALESIMQQSYTKIELVIIDGKSTDQTIKIIKRYQAGIAYWISEPDKGIYDAWNKGVKIAKGDWIMFLGCDDILLPRAVESYIKFINENGLYSKDYISSRVELITQDGRSLRVIGKPWNWKEFKIVMDVAHVGSLHNKELFKKYGLYDITYKIAGDYELLLRAKSKLKTGYMNLVTAKMRLGGVSLNNVKVFKETFTAKNKTAGRPLILCAGDYLIARAKFIIKSFLS